MISNTYYHNFVTHLMEAAYQREVYKLIDAGDSVQAETLSSIMKETLQKFWGDDVEISDDAALTWMRQPHYYMGLYSYTYSAGLTVATQVCKRIETEGQTAVDDWKNGTDRRKHEDTGRAGKNWPALISRRMHLFSIRSRRLDRSSMRSAS